MESEEFFLRQAVYPYRNYENIKWILNGNGLASLYGDLGVNSPWRIREATQSNSI